MGTPVFSTKACQCRRSLAHQNTAAGHDQRALCGANGFDGTIQRGTIRLAAADEPHALFKKLFRVIVGLGLHVLRQRQRHCAAIGGRGEHAHGFRQRGDQLLGPIDAVPIPRYGFETVVHTRILRRRRFNLLQDRRHIAPRKDVAGQQQHRQAIDGGQRRAGNHVGCARPDGRRAGVGTQTVTGFGKAGGEMHAGLLVAHQDIWKIEILLQRLADAGDISVAKDAEHSGKKLMLPAISLHILILEKANQRLCCGHAPRRHIGSP